MDRGRPRPYTVKADQPYALEAGQGWTYNQDGVAFTVKAGELGRGRRLAVVEYTTRRGEEPPDHTHDTEDEICYVLAGAASFRCGDERFEVGEGGFVFLPRGIEHGYRVRGPEDVRLLAITSPAREDAVGGWGGFVGDFEAMGELRAAPPGFEAAE
ncbi:MAG TPA: cupin domain-containing protein [Streptosporangiaceae bacterium]|nr:cupin domain-containing protein [Streptosporangiaceae bacterium]